MIVLTADQRGSRRVGDRVPELLATLSADGSARHAVLAFDRTVGDEVQGVFDNPAHAIETALRLIRLGEWSVGIGAGPVDEPLAAEVRAGSGPAFVHARTAVERSKSRLRPVPLAVEGEDPERAHEAEAVLILLGSIATRRTSAGWAVIDDISACPAGTQEEVARRLGISQQAVVQRLRSAMWSESLPVKQLAVRLLQEAQEAQE